MIKYTPKVKIINIKHTSTKTFLVSKINLNVLFY